MIKAAIIAIIVNIIRSFCFIDSYKDLLNGIKHYFNNQNPLSLTMVTIIITNIWHYPTWSAPAFLSNLISSPISLFLLTHYFPATLISLFFLDNSKIILASLGTSHQLLSCKKKVLPPDLYMAVFSDISQASDQVPHP